MYTIEELDELGRSKGLVIYAIHQANAGWGCQWYEWNSAELWGDGTPDPGWRKRLVVYNYYPTVAEMIEGETERLKQLEVVADA